ncbi:MAG TPA: lipoyl(octanoyl) transferase LipB, partial [Gemmatimonadaceae bacterium]|nr:lipoyl(octanoyl) transferase LipB [Gemmatimonadaceae bacterium]
RSSHVENLLLSPTELAARGIALHESGRGGDVTFHGPGQLVGYPVIGIREDRRDLHRYLRDLEEALIRTAASFGIEATRSPGRTGIWVGDEKLAAIGVRVSTGWIAWHGFALNVGSDLAGFETIVPCGIADKGVTSIARLTGSSPDLREVAASAARHVADVLGFEPFASGVAGEGLAIPPPSPLSSPPRRVP